MPHCGDYHRCPSFAANRFVQISGPAFPMPVSNAGAGLFAIPECFHKLLEGTIMSRIFNVVQDLSIGVKLGITSAIAVLLVSGMLWSQLRTNAMVRDFEA